MSVYTTLTAALGAAYGSPAIERVAASLATKRALRKEGGYRASLTFKHAGVYLIFNWQRPSWIARAAILYPEGVERFRAFPEPVEGTVPMSATRSLVREVLGQPSRSGGTGRSLDVLTDWFWDRYDLAAYCLRFDYCSAEGAIRVVRLMTRDCARELNADLQ